MPDDRFLAYGRQNLDADDVEAVGRTLQSDYLTTGPEVAAFEQDLVQVTGAARAVVLNSCTSALHAIYAAIGLGPGDEVIMSPMTFAATANAALYLGARPVFTDVDAALGLLDPALVEAAITPKTRAIVAVDYAGQPADYDALRAIANRHQLALIADGAHSLGANDKGRAVGTLADATALSFHPVKLITTGEGGAVVTSDSGLADRVTAFRSHGIVHDRSKMRRDDGPWYMEMRSLGYNYRLTDFQCALGRSQLRKLPTFLARRRDIADVYDRELESCSGLAIPGRRDGVLSAWHLYPIRVEEPALRRSFFESLRSVGIGVQVHYLPVYRHPYYQDLGYEQDACPAADAFYSRVVSLPMHPGLSDADVARVTDSVLTVAQRVLR